MFHPARPTHTPTPMPAGKAFFDAEYAVGISKMTYRDVLDALTWLDERFHLIRPPKHTMPTIEYILDKARAAVLRWAAGWVGAAKGWCCWGGGVLWA